MMTRYTCVVGFVLSSLPRVKEANVGYQVEVNLLCYLIPTSFRLTVVIDIIPTDNFGDNFRNTETGIQSTILIVGVDFVVTCEQFPVQ